MSSERNKKDEAAEYPVNDGQEMFPCLPGKTDVLPENEEHDIPADQQSDSITGIKSAGSGTDSMKQYEVYISKIKEIDREEMGRLWERVKRGDRRAKDKIFEQNMKLVISVVVKNHASYSYIDKLDLIEEGNLGLYHAIDKYDPALGYRFSTYAKYWIEQHIRRYIEESSKTIRIPPHAWTDMRKWQREYKKLQEKLGRPPEISEVMIQLDWSESKVRAAMHTADIVTGISSIEEPRGTHEDGTSTIEDTLHSGNEDSPEHLATETNQLEVLKKALGELDPREREILEARYGLLGDDKKTLNQIGCELNLSRERVRQLEARALQTLRRAVISKGLTDENSRKSRAGVKKNNTGQSRLEILSLAIAGKKNKKTMGFNILKIPRKNNER